MKKRKIIAALALAATTLISPTGRADPFPNGGTCSSSAVAIPLATWDWLHTFTYTAGNYCWNSPSFGTRFVWQADGNLVIYDRVTSGGDAIWNSGTYGRGYYLVFQTDGNTVIYTASHVAIWWTAAYPVYPANCRGFSFGETSPIHLAQRWIIIQPCVYNGYHDMWTRDYFNPNYV